MKKLFLVLSLCLFFALNYPMIVNAEENDIVFNQVFVGSDNAIAIADNEDIYAWGYNSYGQLGDGTDQGIDFPKNITSHFSLNTNEIIVDISLGSLHTGFLSNQGRLFICGSNEYGQLGNNSTVDLYSPTNITDRFNLNSSEEIINIHMNNGKSMAFTNQGRLFVWGENSSGELANGTTTDLHTPTDITAHFSLAINEKLIGGTFANQSSVFFTDQNRVFTAGQNTRGVLGNGSSYVPCSYTPLDISSRFTFVGLEEITKVSAAEHHVSLLTSEGQVYSWGSNVYSTLGDGTSINRSTPVNITSRFNLVTDYIIDIEVQDYYVVALSNSGKVFSFGSNYYGVLGNNDTASPVNSPTEITSYINSTQPINRISCGLRNALVMSGNNEMLMWGYGNNLNLEDTYLDTYAPLSFETPDFKKPEITCADETVQTSNAMTWTNTVSAMDNRDGDITNQIITSYYKSDGITTLSDISAARDELFAGKNIFIEYVVSDQQGNTSDTETVQISSVDNTKPTLELNGAETIYLEYEADYVDLGATYSDNHDNSGSVIINNTVDSTTLGTYTVTYSANDTSGNEAIPIVRTVIVQDTEKPTLELNGSETIYLEYEADYVDLGATYSDNHDNSGSVTINSTVDATTLGTYTVTYSANDTSGNEAIPVVRTVIVQDTEKPTLELNGSETVYLEYEADYVDLGANFSDNHDNSGSVTINSTVDTTTLGSYTVTYSANDTSGNEAIPIVRTVIVQDIEKPILELNGAETIYVEYEADYVDLGATYSDNHDNSGSVTINSTVDTTTLGTYTVTYSANDTSGNEAIPIVRTVIVQDIEKPILELNGAETIYVEYEADYVDLGAVFSDNHDNSGSVTINSTVDTTTLGTYTITYSANDTSGNEAIPIVRKVVVQDSEKPTLELNGEETVYLEYEADYVDLGANFSDNHDNSGTVTINSTVDTTTLGTYTVTYSANDTSGNEAIPVVRTVIVQDTEKPILELNGAETIYLEYEADYVDLGAIFSDNHDNSGSVTINSTVDSTTLGTYTVIYSANDTSGNDAIPVVRTVIVQDTTCPKIKNLVNDQDIPFGEDILIDYDEGVAYLNGEICEKGTVVYKPGNYRLLVTDESGNTTNITFTIAEANHTILYVLIPIVLVVLGCTVYMIIRRKRHHKDD